MCDSWPPHSPCSRGGLSTQGVRHYEQDSDVRGAGSTVVFAAAAQRQQPAQRSVFERYSEPIEIYKSGLGTFTRPISSANKEAQAFFNQGFQMMYSFAKPEAVRSFRESWKRDPNCAICYWGEAWAWGSYLNAPMTAQEAPHAYAAAQKAVVAQGAGERAKSARSSTRWPCATWRSSIPRSGSIRTRPTRRRWRRWPRGIRTISTPRRCMPTRCSCWSRGAARAT